MKPGQKQINSVQTDWLVHTEGEGYRCDTLRLLPPTGRKANCFWNPKLADFPRIWWRYSQKISSDASWWTLWPFKHLNFLILNWPMTVFHLIPVVEKRKKWESRGLPADVFVFLALFPWRDVLLSDLVGILPSVGELLPTEEKNNKKTNRNESSSTDSVP